MEQSISNNEVGIVVTYSLVNDGGDRNVYSETFTSDGTREESASSSSSSGILGKPTTSEKLVPGDYSYSGRHDHGELPPLRGEQSGVGKLLGCMKRAQEHNDRFLTKKIQEHKDREIKNDGDCDPPNKKPKV
ncbi:MAG: hypothetical protein SGBAC_003754 [Bacillariaceae sp.]